jgi:hypothetical protein
MIQADALQRTMHGVQWLARAQSLPDAAGTADG